MEGNMQNIGHMILNLLFLTLLVLTIVSLGITLVKSVIIAWKLLMKNKQGINKKGYLVTVTRCAIFAALTLFVMGISQWTASTPKIEGENAISELREVTFNGRKQWISIRGENKDAPILLFLAGGPGGSQLAAVRYEMPELEKEFVLVGWDQPGSAKSYGARKDLTAEDYLQDGLALTEYLCERFDKEKIYLVGESWGSYLSIMMAAHTTERFYGIANTGQMVDFLETELIDYTTALTLCTENGDTDKMTQLIKLGTPPYYGNDVSIKSAKYIGYLTSKMNHNPDIKNPGYRTDRDILSVEYGILDKANYVLGILNTYNDVYQQLYEIDLRESHTKLDVPIKFIIGRHDLNAPTSLAAEYFDLLQAPAKEFVWFEHSGHSPWVNESERFVEELLKFKDQVEHQM
jgi:pimeloyl-ACP methyl ester carboxylesterase